MFFTQPTGGAAANNGNHDPRLLYIVVLGSSRAHHITPKRDARDDVIAVDVIGTLVRATHNVERSPEMLLLANRQIISEVRHG
jgi:hypothetical protein